MRRVERGTTSRRRRVCELNGYEWFADEVFEIDRLLDRKVESQKVGRVRALETLLIVL